MNAEYPAGPCGQHLERAHHFVVFVFENVAVPEVAAGVWGEGDDDAGRGSGVGADGVFPAEAARE